MIYDVVIIWAWAAWLFTGIHLDKNIRKIILEKNAKPWVKVLLSWGERANVSNMDIEPVRDYFTQNKKSLLSVFSQYNNWDIMSFFAENNVFIVEEDRSRLILESWDSKELLECLLQNVRKNNCELKVNQDVQKLRLWEDSLYEVETIEGVKYQAKQVVISSWGKSFSQVGTTGQGYSIANDFWIEIIPPYRTLCWMSTKRDVSEIRGVSCQLDMKLVDKITSKTIYEEFWPLLFTHFWVSGPIVHNLSNAIWEYLNSFLKNEWEFEKYLMENLCIQLCFDLESTPKRVIKFFQLNEDNTMIQLDLQNWRSWKEAKATGGWVSMNELDNKMQAKKSSGMYFIWEVVDVTGKTGGFNLQWAWSSAYVCAHAINKKISE